MAQSVSHRCWLTRELFPEKSHFCAETLLGGCLFYEERIHNRGCHKAFQMLTPYPQDWYLMRKSCEVTLTLDPKEDSPLSRAFQTMSPSPLAERGGQAVCLNWNASAAIRLIYYWGSFCLRFPLNNGSCSFNNNKFFLIFQCLLTPGYWDKVLWSWAN